MAKPYSTDIRNRVIRKHDEGKKVYEIANELSVKKILCVQYVGVVWSNRFRRAKAAYRW